MILFLIKLVLKRNKKIETDESAKQNLSERSKQFFALLPSTVQKQIFQEKDPHGNIPLSQIQTELVIIEWVKNRLKEKEQEEDKLFWETFDEFKKFIYEKTNCTVLQHPQLEADDLIAGFIQCHPTDDHVIISSDTDFHQLLAENVFHSFCPASLFQLLEALPHKM